MFDIFFMLSFCQIIVTKRFTNKSILCQIRNLTHHLFEDWKLLKTAEEYKIMKSYAETGKQYCLIYFGEI